VSLEDVSQALISGVTRRGYSGVAQKVMLEELQCNLLYTLVFYREQQCQLGFSGTTSIDGKRQIAKAAQARIHVIDTNLQNDGRCLHGF